MRRSPSPWRSPRRTWASTGGDPDELYGQSGSDTFLGRGHEVHDLDAGESYPESVPPTAGPHTVVPIDPEVVFPDSGLHAAVASALGIPVTQSHDGKPLVAGPIFASQLAGLVRLDASGWNILSLEGLERVTDLRALNLSHTGFPGPQAVPPHLRQLQILGLASNGITEINAADLAHLPALEQLFLDDNEITDLTDLVGTYI
ncbi:MAG: leucine-rich repeat domain-containing protein, partial [Planctomycetota bacterium]